MSRRMGRVAFVLCFLMASVALAAATYDEGRFDPSWFGAPTGEFREADDIDYLWVKPGFSLTGKKIRFAPWADAVFLGEEAEKRDAKDKRLANDISGNMPEMFAEAFGNTPATGAVVVKSGGEIVVSGQVVDCSTGNAAAKFWVGMGAGSGGTTFNLKFVDAKSGEVVVAMHHRVVSGTSLSTTDSKLVKWVDEFAEELAKNDFQKQYQSGKKVKE